jgi:hypothetical protein
MISSTCNFLWTCAYILKEISFVWWTAPAKQMQMCRRRSPCKNTSYVRSKISITAHHLPWENKLARCPHGGSTLEAPSSARSLQLYRGYNIFHLSYCEYSHPEIEHMRTDQLDITWRRTKFTLSAVHGCFLHENYVKVDLFTNTWIWVCHLKDHLVLRCSCNWISQK